MQLGDLGADVIKIEPPEGDASRLFGRPTKGGVTASFLNFNRNKRSIVVDLKKEHGRDLVRRLAVKADVMVENNRPGVADRLGIGYAEIRRLNPKIIYCSICGFGPKGQSANAPAYDPVIQGFSGVAFLQGGREGRPTAVKMALADKISGMTAALSIVSALHAARSRGVGQYIRVPMTEAMMAFTANDATYLGYTFQPDEEFKDKVPKSGSLDPFKTQDGWVTIAPFTDDQWERLCKCLGHAEWWEMENRADRMRAALRGIAKQLPEQSSAHWLKVFEEADIPSGPVHNYDTLFTEPEVVANENFTMYEHPQAGQVRTVNPGMRFSETPARMWRPPPRLGEHTEEVLREAGFERDQLEELRAEKVIN
jgi:crotonobetainyl-CoA:carnitine CoA-transferase CaiB-like acyl-CoA transferase